MFYTKKHEITTKHKSHAIFLCYCCLHVMSTWKQNSKEFEDSMVRDIVEGIDYRMKLEGMDTEVLKELEQVFGFGVLRICEISLMHASFF